MITLTGEGVAHTCHGITRRDFLQLGALGGIGLSLPQLCAWQAAAATPTTSDERSVIMIFNLGAPSHLDTFDPKPQAPADVRGPFRAIRTASPDIRLSEILARTASVADKFSLVRSCYHNGPAVHDVGHQWMQTGRLFTRELRSPHAGCVAGYLRGSRGSFPAHVILPAPMGRTGGNMPHGQDAGFLGPAQDPVVLDADPAQQPSFQPAATQPGTPGAVEIKPRRRIRDAVEDAIGRFENSPAANGLEGPAASAYRLLTSQAARVALDLGREPRHVRERYGRTRFGQSCLLARRLIEAGVRFVTVNTFISVFNEITWDIHGSAPFTSIAEMRAVVAPMYDQAYSALLEDLAQRGLLGNTLVCSLQEFGRTPKINASGGRDHWPQCWTVAFAGGGVQGGRVVGKSDEIGAYPADRPVTPPEVVATIYRSLGIDLAATLPGPSSSPVPVVDYGIHEIQELF